MSGVPIVRLEIAAMKETMLVALSDRIGQINADIQAAIEAFCSEGSLKQVIEEQVRVHLEAAVKEEVRNFFSWTAPGRLVVKQAVLARLNEWEQSQSRFDKDTPC